MEALLDRTQKPRSGLTRTNLNFQQDERRPRPSNADELASLQSMIKNIEFPETGQTSKYAGASYSDPQGMILKDIFDEKTGIISFESGDEINQDILTFLKKIKSEKKSCDK